MVARVVTAVAGAAVRAGKRLTRKPNSTAPNATRGATGAAGAVTATRVPNALRIGGGLAVGAVVLDEILSEDQENLIESSTESTPAVQELNLDKNQLGLIKFPLDIENAPIPHLLIKIFETQTGAVERTDITSQSLVGGTQNLAEKADQLNLGTVVGALAGGNLATTPAALLALGGRWKAAGLVLGAGVAAGGALVGTGAAGAIAENLADFAGEAGLGIDDTANRFKTALRNFALKRNIEQLRLAIALLMPETLSVSYQNQYDTPSLTEALGGVGLAAQALGTDFGKAGDAANPYLIEAAARLAGQNISEQFRQIGLFATTGRTLNPQIEVIYNSPALREFTMDFRLVPRNPIEAAQIRNIIGQLKYFAAPQIPPETSGRYFIPPAQFELEFYDAENNQNQFLFRTKKCVLEDISVDYTGNGSFNTFYDGSPVETRLSLRFRETVFIDRQAVTEGY